MVKFNKSKYNSKYNTEYRAHVADIVVEKAIHALVKHVSKDFDLPIKVVADQIIMSFFVEHLPVYLNKRTKPMDFTIIDNIKNFSKRKKAKALAKLDGARKTVTTEKISKLHKLCLARK